MNFVLEKQLIKFSCTYQPLLFCKIRVDSELRECAPFLGPKQPICPEQVFWYKPLLLVLFTVQNFKKFLQQIQNYDNASFLGPKWSIYCKKMFFWEIIPIILIYLLVPFIVQKFLKNRIQSYEHVQFKDHFPK